MSLRVRFIVYSSILVGLVILYAIGFATSPVRQRLRPEALMPGFSAQVVVGFEISDPNRTVSVIVDDDGWHIEQAGDLFPARSDRIDIFLEELERSRIVRLVSRDAETHSTFGVGDDATRLTIQMNGADSAATLVWGKPASEPGLTYVRWEDDVSVFATDGRITFYVSQPATYWSYLRVFPESLTPSDIVALRVVGDVPGDDSTIREVRYSLERREHEQTEWVLAGAETKLDQRMVSRLLRDIADLVGMEFIADIDSIIETRFPMVVTIEIDTASGKRFSAEIRARSDDYVVLPVGPGLPGEPYGGLAYVIEDVVLRRITPDTTALLPRGE